MYVYTNLKFYEKFSFKLATEICLFIATFVCSSVSETHQGRTHQVKQEAGPEASLSTLMLRHF
jgi:hypothetical protein